ncbi:cysteine desulfurase family protein [Salisediminibacterium halotolerans]|uniref:cysteine desulfurase n=1 Tax=Salisediminibacterium halotolerans TaxID=517425 RepID=A0A1H9VA41_9BACI|nr:cysteine desulfurase family protein [Salisediminibacterium haloalkalitolerans]SES18690.1 cysteine desulfurase [Salisediminibacterium haloalkalitolerans]
MKRAIYMDHAATAPVDREVAEAMQPYMTEMYGNPSSIHQFGRQTRKAVDDAKETMASAIGAGYNELIFTSGGTEADNLAVFSAAYSCRDQGKHLITTAIEHHAVLHAFNHLETQGFDVTYLKPDEYGIVSAKAVKEAITAETTFVSVMYGNNETGMIQPVLDIAEMLNDRGILFHTDAVQALGTESFDLSASPIDYAAFSAHKINGPKGIGLLYVKEGAPVMPMFHGGEQEKKRRPGTENVPAIVGFAAAVAKVSAEKETRKSRYAALKEDMLQRFSASAVHYVVNGDQDRSLPHILNISFPGVNIEALLMNLDMDGLAVSSGSACTAGSVNPSHVLTAMTDDEAISHTGLRISFGLGNTNEDAAAAAEMIIRTVKRLQ